MLFNPEWETQVQPIIKPAQKILLDAAALLETEGWCQGSYLNSKGNFCAVGAISKAADVSWCGYDNGDNAKSYHAAMDALRQVIDSSSITIWNDRLWRTKRGVVKKLREAASAV